MFDDMTKQWTLPLASEFSQTDWTKKERDVTESDIYLEVVLNELQQKQPGLKPTDVSITVADPVNGLPSGHVRRFRIILENKSLNSGENAIYCEELLREYLKDFQPLNGQPKKVIFVKAPLLLMRGWLTLKNPGPDTLKKAKVDKEDWLGGDTQVLPYTDDCPRLAILDPLKRVEVLVEASGEYKKICNYNNKHLIVEEDFWSEMFSQHPISSLLKKV